MSTKTPYYLETLQHLSKLDYANLFSEFTCDINFRLQSLLGLQLLRDSDWLTLAACSCFKGKEKRDYGKI